MVEIWNGLYAVIFSEESLCVSNSPHEHIDTISLMCPFYIFFYFMIAYHVAN